MCLVYACCFSWNKIVRRRGGQQPHASRLLHLEKKLASTSMWGSLIQLVTCEHSPQGPGYKYADRVSLTCSTFLSQYQHWVHTEIQIRSCNLLCGLWLAYMEGEKRLWVPIWSARIKYPQKNKKGWSRSATHSSNHFQEKALQLIYIPEKEQELNKQNVLSLKPSNVRCTWGCLINCCAGNEFNPLQKLGRNWLGPSMKKFSSGFADPFEPSRTPEWQTNSDRLQALISF